MRTRDEELDQILDEALAEIRSETADSPAREAALDRVWGRLSPALGQTGPATHLPAEPIRSCEGFQALLPELLEGRLSPARKLLVQDHLGECVPCRRAYKSLATRSGGSERSTVAMRRRSGRLATFAWRGAAVAAIAFAVIGFGFKTDVFSYESGGLIRIQSVDGELLRVNGEEAVPLAAGDEVRLSRGEQVRTAKDSSAVLRLADDSRVELRERSELAVRQRHHLLPTRGADGVIDLDRGSIIVEASEQGSGHLHVDTDDCKVAVKGTVFSVSHGMKGSRVSVVDGEVQVSYAGREDRLQPGQQATTHPALDSISVASDISWSRNRRAYLETLNSLGHEIDEVLRPELRHSQDLLDLVPADTAIYVAIPNLSGELSQAYELFRQKVAANELLRGLWDEAGPDEAELARIFDEIGALGDPLGTEVVMAMGAGRGSAGEPLFLSRLDDPAAFRSEVERKLASLEEDDAPVVRFFEGDLPATPEGRLDVSFWLHDDLVAVTTSFDRLRALDGALQDLPGSRLAGSAFHARLADLYAEGVEWIVAVDLEPLLAAGGSSHERLEALGLADVQHLIGERKQLDDMTHSRVELSFSEPRKRLAAWLAPPAPMGSLDYVSPEASLAVGFVTEDPERLVQDLFDFIGQADPDFTENLARFEAEHEIDIRRDLAAPLGGEFSLAVDGPLLPTPSWKLIVEVYDPARLEKTLDWLAQHVGALAREHGGPGLELQREDSGGRRYLHLVSDAGLGAHMTFDGGYLIAAPSRGLLDRALAIHESGISLPRSSTFLHLLPRDRNLDFSGVVYQNLAPILGPLAGAVERTAGLTGAGSEAVKAMAAGTQAGMALLYGERDRIVLSSRSDGGLFSAGLRALAGLHGFPLGVQESLARAVEQDAHGSQP